MAFASKRARTEKAPLEVEALYEVAVRALARKMRTVSELKRLLQARVEPGENGTIKVAAVLAKLTEQKYLDDAAYASTFTRLRQENEKFGRRRVQQDLMQRGVRGELVTETLDAAYANLPEETQIRRYLERKRVAPPTDEKKTARVVRMLVRAGFRTASIFKVLKQWNAPEAALETVEAMDEDGEAAE